MFMNCAKAIQAQGHEISLLTKQNAAYLAPEQMLEGILHNTNAETPLLARLMDALSISKLKKPVAQAKTRSDSHSRHAALGVFETEIRADCLYKPHIRLFETIEKRRLPHSPVAAPVCAG
jgi:hypothetical protein